MAGISESFYHKSPIWLQQLAVASYGFWWYRRRFGSHFHRLVEELKSRERFSADQFRSYQADRLRRVLIAGMNSPYYKNVFHEARIDPVTMDPFELLGRMPLLSKETLRTKARELLTQPRNPAGTVVFKSSGTTGTPTEIYYTQDFHALELAAPEVRNLNWAGVNYKSRRVMFGVRKVCHFDQTRPPFWRFSPAENMAYASIYHLSHKLLPHYLEFLRAYRPEILMGYPSALNSIASYVLESGDRPAPIKAVFTTSETVTASIREKVESAFDCKIYDRYCAVEMCLFASQCEHGRYHVSPDIGIVEIVDADGQPVQPGAIGQVICTGLHNTLQPLIRYQIGDAARWSLEQNCQCGRAMPILEAIEGRFEDVCYTPDGREMLRFDTVFKGVDNIREAQVIQESLKIFTINVVPSSQFTNEDVNRILDNMRLHVGQVEARINPVESIPRTNSGKFRAVICKLDTQQKQRLRQTVIS